MASTSDAPVARDADAAALGLDASALGALAQRIGAFAVLDLETTGLADDDDARIIDIGTVEVDLPAAPGAPARIAIAQTLVQPGRALPRAIVRLTGLTDAQLDGAPSIEVVAPWLAARLSGRTVIAHNAEFERHFLTRQVDAAFATASFVDTQDLVALTHPDAPDLRLETFTRLLLGTEERHRAFDDALDTARVMSAIARGAAKGEARYANARDALRQFAPDSPWRALLAPGAPQRSERASCEATDAATAAGERAPAVGVSEPFAREAPVAFDERAIVAALEDEARGRRYFAGYRVRAEQIRLARAFVRALRDGDWLLAEGGTGVGKSLAYLAAAIPFVMTRTSDAPRTPVVVSTRTKLLQDQLLAKDIPAAARMLGWPGLSVVSIKGRANYACARRLGLALAGSESLVFAEDRLARAALAACASTRPDGELGSVPAALRRRFSPLHGLLHQSVAARAEQCSREQCAQEGEACPFGRKRARLAKASLVVTNHDLLLRWPPDYPAFAHAIVDEAHELAGVTDEVLSVDVAPDEILDRLDDVFGRSGDTRKSGALLRGKARRALAKDATAWRRAIAQDLLALGRTLGELASEFGELQLGREPESGVTIAARIAFTLEQRLDEVSRTIDGCTQSDPYDEAARTALARIAGELRGFGSSLRSALDGAGEDAVASFEGLVAPWDRWRLKVRPVEPAQAFHARFLERLASFSAVSASLFVGESAFASLGELEIEERNPARVQRQCEPSPFDYASRMRVVAMETPERDVVEETARVIAGLAGRLGGRTLGLFTSLRRMRECAELLAEPLRGEGIELLMPRRAFDDPAALVERFRQGGAVLLGARTFWQGLDLPGETLEAVVIEKLPFEVPTELRRRREERLRRAGFDPFDRFALGKMLLNLKQMVGRLIRSEDDRGLVVIVDGRPGKRYFRRLGDALPPGTRVRVARRDGLDALMDEIGLSRAGSRGV